MLVLDMDLKLLEALLKIAYLLTGLSTNWIRKNILFRILDLKYTTEEVTVMVAKPLTLMYEEEKKTVMEYNLTMVRIL